MDSLSNLSLLHPWQSGVLSDGAPALVYDTELSSYKRMSERRFYKTRFYP